MASSGIVDIVTSVVSLTREIDGKIYNSTTGLYEPATAVSLAAANTMVVASTGAVLDTLPFPFSFPIMGGITININRTAVDAAMVKLQAAARAYVVATTK